MKLIAGIDDLSLDNRTFDVSREEIQRICRFFSMGELDHFEKEKGTVISHSNHFVYAATDQGQFALKFYPAKAARSIMMEYAQNRFLRARHFQTALMYAGHQGQASVPSNGRCASCYSFIDGVPVWKRINQLNTIQQVNASLLSLKEILSSGKDRIPCQEQESLPKTINTLIKISRQNSPYDQETMINASLKDAFQSYQQHQRSFKRQRLHNNANLTNFLIQKNKAYCLDLSHIREDYDLADLASLIISCLFFEIASSTIKKITDNYFTQDKTGPKDLLVLNTLIKAGLIREYLKNIQRENSVEFASPAPGLRKIYLSQLAKRKRTISDELKKNKDNRKFML